MPPISRDRKLADIRLGMKSIVDDLAKAVRFNNLGQFKSTAHSVRTITTRLIQLEEDTRMASRGYVSNPKARRALDIASRELDALAVQLQEWQEMVDLCQELPEMARLNLELLKRSLEMKQIVFSPDIPRPKLSQDELHQIEVAETSPETERAYSATEVLQHMNRYSQSNISQQPTAAEILAQVKKNHPEMAPLTEPVDPERMQPLNPTEADALKHLTGE